MEILEAELKVTAAKRKSFERECHRVTSAFASMLNAVAITDIGAMKMLPDGTAQRGMNHPDMPKVALLRNVPNLVYAIEDDGHLQPMQFADDAQFFKSMKLRMEAMHGLQIGVYQSFMQGHREEGLRRLQAAIRLSQWPAGLHYQAFHVDGGMAIVWEAIHARRWKHEELQRMKDTLELLPPRSTARALYQEFLRSFTESAEALRSTRANLFSSRFDNGIRSWSQMKPDIQAAPSKFFGWAMNRTHYRNYQAYGFYREEQQALSLLRLDAMAWQTGIESGRMLEALKQRDAIRSGMKLETNRASLTHILTKEFMDFDDVQSPAKWMAARETGYRLSVTALSLEQFHREHGQYPESLSKLVPKFLPEVPIDVMDGQPLRFRRIKKRFDLYSVGLNGTDDGGVGVTTTIDPQLWWIRGRDWIWPHPAK